MQSVHDMMYITLYSYSRWGYNPPNGDGYFLPAVDKTLQPKPSKIVQEFYYPTLVYTSKGIKWIVHTTVLQNSTTDNAVINPTIVSPANMTGKNINPFDASQTLDRTFLLPKIMYPRHLDPCGELLENAVPGYHFFNIPVPSDNTVQ
uniref:Uncharacterized protein n=1 Tax=Lygus hesperus TaxID=30085 RepID=A0A146KVR6_LYGHE